MKTANVPNQKKTPPKEKTPMGGFSHRKKEEANMPALMEKKKGNFLKTRE